MSKINSKKACRNNSILRENHVQCYIQCHNGRILCQSIESQRSFFSISCRVNCDHLYNANNGVSTFVYMVPAKFAWSVAPFPFEASDGFVKGHLLVTLIRLEKNSTPPSPVMSISPYLLWVPYSPPKLKGSRGTGIPMLQLWRIRANEQ